MAGKDKVRKHPKDKIVNQFHKHYQSRKKKTTTKSLTKNKGCQTCENQKIRSYKLERKTNDLYMSLYQKEIMERENYLKTYLQRLKSDRKKMINEKKQYEELQRAKLESERLRKKNIKRAVMKHKKRLHKELPTQQPQKLIFKL